LIVADTNIVVRFLVDEDDARQRQVAEALVRSGGIRLLSTVLLETEWVLRSRYRFSPQQIAGGLRRLTALAEVEVEDADRVAQALEWFEAGLDFADALHLAATSQGESFVTFDQDLIRRTARLGVAVPVREP
jgi:predicted nucleic-acid-binding protein